MSMFDREYIAVLQRKKERENKTYRIALLTARMEVVGHMVSCAVRKLAEQCRTDRTVSSLP